MPTRRAKSINDMRRQAERIVRDIPEIQGGVLTRDQQRAMRVIRMVNRYSQNIKNALERGEQSANGSRDLLNAKFDRNVYIRATAIGSST